MSYGPQDSGRWITASRPGRLAVVLAVVCPQAPPGMQNYVDSVTGWVMWGVLAILVIAGFVSIGSILAGRIFAHPHGSRYGAIGLTVTVICAVLYVTVPTVLNSIVAGAEC
jgi:hypothetical protein